MKKKGKTLYFDCYSGVSGDMILGAFMDIGLPVEGLRKQLLKVGLRPVKMSIRKVERGHLEGTKLTMFFTDKTKQRNLSDIRKIIRKSSLSPAVKKDSIDVFGLLYSAEGRVHGKKDIYLHELSADDTIADIIGTCWAMEYMGISRCLSSPVNLGHGTVRYSDGVLPVPAPATLEILKGVPVYSSGPASELTTPTGAVLLKYFVRKYSPLPVIRYSRIGYGAGDRVFPGYPNFLRVIMSEDSIIYDEDIVHLETNIDDMNPQIYGYLFDLLFGSGALDVWLENIYMKKGRPGIQLNVLCDITSTGKMEEIIFKETTTLGIRYRFVSRKRLDRECKVVMKGKDRVNVKVTAYDKIIPEFRDCEVIAKRRGLPLRKVIRKFGS